MRRFLPWSNLNSRCFIVAEMSANHHQSLQRAVAIIQAAKAVGADAVKIQMFKPEQMCPDSDSPDFFIKEGQWKGIRLFDLYKESAMPLAWVKELKKFAAQEKIVLFPTLYHPEIIEFAEKLDFPFYKIASFEITWPEFLEKIAQTKKPLIVSTGSAEFNEIKKAVEIMRKYIGNRSFCLLRSVTSYPALIKNTNLRTMTALGHIFKCRYGISDHSKDILVPIVAASLGASVIEKHFTLDGKGLDGEFSLLPDKFAMMVRAIRDVETIMGTVTYGGDKTFYRKLVNGQMLRVC